MVHRLLAAAFVAALLLSLVRVSPVVAEESAAKPADYLIVAADGLGGVAKEWGEYRKGQGRQVEVVTLGAIAKEAGKDKINLLDLKNYIKKHGGEKPAEGFQVLLIGDCPVEGSEGYDAKTEIPWFMSAYKDAYERSAIPGDNFLADTIGEDNEIPDFAIGRIPARTPEQASLALKKVKAYESARLGEWIKRLTFFAGEGRFGAAVDQMLENLFTQMAEQVIDPAYDLRMTYANIKSAYAYVPSRFSDKVLEEANTGAFLLSYMGHGAVDRLDDMHVSQGEGKRDLRYPILQDDDVVKFNIEDGKLPVMIIVACATGFLDHKEQCLTERICFAEKAPVAVISSSRDSHPYSNTLLQNAMITEMTKNRRATLGECFMRAKREIVQGEDKNRKSLENMAAFIIPKKSDRDKLNRAHLYLYNLIGDPGLKLRYPGSSVKFEPAKPEAFKGGEVEVAFALNDPLPSNPVAKSTEAASVKISATLEVRRSQVFGELKAFDAKDLISSDEAKRKAAEDAIAANHATANTKVLAPCKLSGVDYSGGGCTGGKFIINIDEALAPGDYVVKLFALDSKGAHCGFAALKLKVKEKE